jgi:alpha-galactosidase
LLNLGNPGAWQWLVNHIDSLIKGQGIDLYRQDFNMDPLEFWRAQDGPDRQGITEIKYVTGYLAFWDELRRRNPNLLIDSCASGGRRNDLETMRRSVPFLRSDYLFEPVSQQGHTFGASFWLPHHGTGTIVGPSALFKELKPGEVNAYMFRSHMCPTVIACWDVRRADLDYAELRRLSGQLRRVQPFYYGDYFPLTAHSMAQNVWMAWQFDRADLGGGAVQAFRRADSPTASARFKLNGLLPRAQYEVENLDGGKSVHTGRELMESGLDITLPAKPSAAVFVYRRVK